MVWCLVCFCVVCLLVAVCCSLFAVSWLASFVVCFVLLFCFLIWLLASLPVVFFCSSWGHLFVVYSLWNVLSGAYVVFSFSCVHVCLCLFALCTFC